MSTTEEKAAIEIHHEMGNLPKLMSIPGKVLSVKWQVDESRMNAGSLFALLEFSDEDKTKIVNDSEKYEIQSNARLDIEFFDTWIPEQARQGIKLTISGTDYELQGVVPVQPNLFTQAELSPYVNGRVYPLAGGFVLVYLYSM